MSGRGKISQLIVFITEDGGKVFQTDLSPPHLQHGSHQPTDHSPEEPVSFYPVNQAAVLLLPAAFIDVAKKGLRLAVPLGKRGEIPAFGNKGGGSLHFLPIEGIGEKIRPVDQERILLPVNKIPVLPANGIKTAMGVGRNGIKILKDDIPGQQRIDIIKRPGIHNSLKINMKKILPGMNPSIRAGGSRQRQGLPEKNGQGLFHLLLDGGRVVLDLESTVIRSFIGDFQEVSGHSYCNKVAHAGTKIAGMRDLRRADPY